MVEKYLNPKIDEVRAIRSPNKTFDSAPAFASPPSKSRKTMPMTITRQPMFSYRWGFLPVIFIHRMTNSPDEDEKMIAWLM